MGEVKRALISVYEKKNVAELARSLSALGIEIISSGGTARLLASSGIKVTEVSDFTGFPEMMDGRVKTLHPKIHGGILADRRKKEHLEQAERQGIGLIDLVVVNLYPFEETITKSGDDLEKVIENIDIGGPALVRSAAKNYRSVAVLVNPERYGEIAAELEKSGKVSDRTRETLVIEAWEHIAHYDSVIENYFRRRLRGMKYPPYLNLTFRKKQDLRYGENPHQTAAFFIDDHFHQHSITNALQLQGKELSYNNILDGNAALELIKEFEDVPTAVVVKHNNPSGVASNGTSILEAFKVARSVDPEAAFGGIFCVNKPVDGALAKEMLTGFVEVVIAPSYSKEALDAFAVKKNVRILTVENIERKREKFTEYRSVVGGLLVQDGNILLHDQKFNVVTKRQPTEEEIMAMKYAWKVAKYVKSNATVFARPDRVVAIGAGQMKRVDATRLAGMIAKGFGLSLKGTAMASDAFFPFRDGVDEAAKLGATAVIQPGGSIRDKEVIAAADEHDIAMVFTGVRHFRH
jgi:phosphoribosylaminoimidazolecarboxamide formyltransferase/IMP cyclohydrolase